MRKVIRLFYTLIKYTLYTVLGTILLVAVLVHLPPVHDFIVAKACAYFNQKTGGQLSIADMDLRLPSYLALEGLRLQTPGGDRLLKFERLELSLGWRYLLDRSIRIDHLLLEEADVDMHFAKGEWNYDFIAKAFSDTTATPSDTSAAPWDFSLGSLRLSEVKAKYYDTRSGDSLDADVGELLLKMERFSVQYQVYLAQEVRLLGSNAYYRMGAGEAQALSSDSALTVAPPAAAGSSRNGTDVTTSGLPTVGLQKLQIDDSKVVYAQQGSADRYSAKIGSLLAEADQIDLEKQRYRLDRVLLQHSQVQLSIGPAASDTSEKVSYFAPIDLQAKSLAVKDFALQMRDPSGQSEALELEAGVLALTEVVANDQQYRAELRGEDWRYNAFDRLERIAAEVSLTPTEASLQRFSLQYGSSTLQADAAVSYASPEELIAELAYEEGHLEIASLVVMPADVAHVSQVLELPDGSVIVPSKPVELRCTLSAHGRAINLPQLRLETGRSYVYLSGNSEWVAAGEPDSLRPWYGRNYRVGKLDIALAGSDLMDYQRWIGLDSTTVPKELLLGASGYFSSDTARLDAQLRGSLGSVSAEVQAGGWAGKRLPLDVELSSPEIKLAWMGIPLSADLQLQASVTNLLDSALSGLAYLHMDTLQYDRYRLRNIEATATLDSSAAALELHVRDTFLLAALTASSTLGSAYTGEVNLEVTGADFEMLGLTTTDLRGQFKAAGNYVYADSLKQAAVAINEVLFVKEEERYPIPEINANYFSSADSTSASFDSSFLTAQSVSNRGPDSLLAMIGELLARCGGELNDPSAFWRASFQTQDQRDLAELFFPELMSFAPANGSIDFESGTGSIQAHLQVPKVVYGNYLIDSLRFKAEGNSSAVESSLRLQAVGLDTLLVKNLELSAHRVAEGAKLELTTRSDTGAVKYRLGATLVADGARLASGFGIHIADTLLLNGARWLSDAANDLHWDPQGIAVKDVSIRRNQQLLSFEKRAEEHATDIRAQNFQLSSLSALISTQQPLLNGVLSGQLRLYANSSFNGDGTIEQLQVAGTKLGKLRWNAQRSGGSYQVSVGSNGPTLAFELAGEVRPLDASRAALDLNFDLQNLDMAALPQLVPAYFNKGRGSLKGQLAITGTSAEPLLAGRFRFREALVGLAANGAAYQIDGQQVEISPSRLSLTEFTLIDSSGEALVINGYVSHEQFEQVKLALELRSNDFTLLDLPQSSESSVYGSLMADLRIDVRGSLDAPQVEAFINIADRSDLAYIVPEDEYESQSEEGLVQWTDFERDLKEDILLRTKPDSAAPKVVFANTVDLNGTLQINPGATFKVIIDTLAGDYLQVQGEGRLGVAYDRAGNFRLNGSYTVKDGFYQLTLYDIIKKRFLIASGSQLIWNGDPSEALLDITALYRTRANVGALMTTGPVAGQSASFQGKLPFEVVMKISGQLSSPEISFDIRLQDEARGALGGAVEARLAELRNNVSEMNKQVFSLLVLNTFMGSSGSDQNILANQARNSASQILTEQLNALSNKLISGVNLNFNLESYGGAAGEGNTDLSIDLQKSFANDRLIVKVGSTIALEENNTAATNTNEVMTNVVIEYKLTPDGRYRFKVYRKTDLEDIVVGRITRTGAGLVFQKDFDRLRYLLDPNAAEVDSVNLEFSKPDSSATDP